MIDMFYLSNITCHILLVCTKIIFLMMLVLYYLDKHIYDIMAFLLTSILWNKLNMNWPKFLTLPRNKWVKCQTIRTKPGHMKHLILYLKPKHLQIAEFSNIASQCRRTPMARTIKKLCCLTGWQLYIYIQVGVMLRCRNTCLLLLSSYVWQYELCSVALWRSTPT